MRFFIVIILILIALIYSLLPVIAQIFVLKIIKVAIIGGILYGIVKMYQVLGFWGATKAIFLFVGGLILFCGIFHLIVGILGIVFFLFW